MKKLIISIFAIAILAFVIIAAASPPASVKAQSAQSVQFVDADLNTILGDIPISATARKSRTVENAQNIHLTRILNLRETPINRRRAEIQYSELIYLDRDFVPISRKAKLVQKPDFTEDGGGFSGIGGDVFARAKV